jgi:hypothetical protein
MPDKKKKSPTTATNGGVTAEQMALYNAYLSKMSQQGSTKAKIGGVGYDPMPNKYTPFEDARNYKRPDELVEDVMEIIDLTGASSWDDAKRGWENWQQSDDTLPDFWDAVDMISAIPAVGSYLSAFKAAQPTFNIAKSTKSSKSFADWVNIVQKTINITDSGGEGYDQLTKGEGEPIPSDMTIEEMSRLSKAFATPPTWLTNNENN